MRLQYALQQHLVHMSLPALFVIHGFPCAEFRSDMPLTIASALRPLDRNLTFHKQPISSRRSSSITLVTISPPVIKVGVSSSSNAMTL